MDVTRLANIIFSKGEKIPEKQYEAICESIASDMFTLSEHVSAYKQHDSVLGKNVYLLEDGSKVLVSTELIETINTLSIDKTRLEAFMLKSSKNFKNVIGTIIDGST